LASKSSIALRERKIPPWWVKQANTLGGRKGEKESSKDKSGRSKNWSDREDLGFWL